MLACANSTTACTPCGTCTAPNEHVSIFHPQCTLTDEAHSPGVIPCKCKRERNAETGEWYWVKPVPPAPACPKHGSGP
jgi:hypothetical protein